MRTSPLAVVLVHGAWHGPWCWDPVQQELAERGIPVVAPALPSTCGDPAALGADEHGNVVVDPSRAVDVFYADCGPAAAAAAVARLTAQNAEPFARTMPAPAWRGVSSTFVVCENDRAIAPVRQRALASRAGEVRSLATSHAAMLARPDLVADVLEGAARQHEGRATG
jgi:hypothetical protein